MEKRYMVMESMETKESLLRGSGCQLPVLVSMKTKAPVFPKKCEPSPVDAVFFSPSPGALVVVDMKGASRFQVKENRCLWERAESSAMVLAAEFFSNSDNL